MKKGLPSSPMTKPAPIVIRVLQWLVILAGKIVSYPTALPMSVVMSLSTLAFS